MVDIAVVTATRGLPRTRTRNVWPIGTWPVIEPWSTTSSSAPGVSDCMAEFGDELLGVGDGQVFSLPQLV